MSTDLPPVAPPPVPAPAPGPASAAGRTAPSGVARIGLLISALAGIAAAAGANSKVVSAFDGQIYVEVGTRMAVIGGILAAVLIAAAFIPATWARVAGTVIAIGLAGFLALALIGSRTDDIFPSDASLTNETGFWLLALGVVLGVVGAIVAMVGIAPPPAGRGAGAGVGAGALVLGIIALVIAPAGAIAAWMGRVAGGGLGWAGWVLGWLGAVGWAIGLTIGVFVAGP